MGNRLNNIDMPLYLRFLSRKFKFSVVDEYSAYLLAKDAIKFETVFDDYCEKIFELTGVSKEVIKSSCRKGVVKDVRYALIYICCKNHTVTLSTIGRMVGRQHSAIINSQKRVEDYFATKDRIFIQVWDKVKHLVDEAKEV